MIALGYMYKPVRQKPDWLIAENVTDLYSIAGWASPNFADYIHYWQHNGHWLFDTPEIIESLAKTHSIDLSEMTLFYYEAYEQEIDYVSNSDNPETENLEWMTFRLDENFHTDVVPPTVKALAGYDVVEYTLRSNPECSALQSSNEIAAICKPNSHCLFDSFDEAKKHLETGIFHKFEPGPYRILAVYVVPRENNWLMMAVL